MEDPTHAFRHFMDYFEKLLTLARYTGYDYSAVIDRNKASILKMVLASVRVYMKEPDNIGHFGRYQSYVTLLKLIKSWGLTWPELDTIVRSLASDRYIKTLNRTTMPLARVVDFSREMLRDGMTVDQLTQSAQDTIEQMKPVFMAWNTFNFKWRTNMHYELDNTMLEYFKKLNAVGLEWPEIAQYIQATTIERAEMQKRNIVTAMITAIKNNEWDDMPHALKELRNLGITWPELTTIERSVNSLSNKQITETAMDDKTYRYHAANIVQHLADSQPLKALRYMGERDITVNNLDSDLRADLEAQKTEAVKNMLQLYKINIFRFGRFLEYVNKTGLDWPELAVINRSFDAEYAAREEEFARHRNY
jgi:hypothetical protein